MSATTEFDAGHKDVSDAEPRALVRQTTPERSHTSSGGGGSVVCHPSDNGASFEASFDAMRISSETEQESSIEFILTPPRVPDPPRLPAVDESMFSGLLPFSSAHLPRALSNDALRSPEMLAEPTKPMPSLLNPLVPPFRTACTAGVQPAAKPTVLTSFHAIIRDGKNTIGELRLDAIAALADLGLKPIPSLHGSALLPYARNPSGLDSFRFSIEEGREAFSPVKDQFGVRAHPGPFPLPVNARYTYAGRLAQHRNSSAPATLGGSVDDAGADVSGTPTKRASKTPRRRDRVQAGVSPSSPAVLAPHQGSPVRDHAQAADAADAAMQAAEEAALAQQQQRDFLHHAQQVQVAQLAELDALCAQLASGINFGLASPAQLPSRWIPQGVGLGFSMSPSYAAQPLQPAFAPIWVGLPPSPPTFPGTCNSAASPDLDLLATAGLTPTTPADVTPQGETRFHPKTSRGRGRARGRNTSDVGTAKEVQLEKDRRKSTTPSFPTRGHGRGSSSPPSIRISPSTPTRERKAESDDGPIPDDARCQTGEPGGTAPSQRSSRRAFSEIGNQAQPPSSSAAGGKQRSASEPALGGSGDPISPSPAPGAPTAPGRARPRSGPDDEQGYPPAVSRLSPVGEVSDAASAGTSTLSSSSTLAGKASKGKKRWRRRGKKEPAPAVPSSPGPGQGDP
ncbi:hypothetical protein JCM3774_002998 [Rhodotorula dairenensis]